MLPPKYFTPPSIRALKFSASAPIVVRASTPIVMPEMVRKLRSLWRATLRGISMRGGGVGGGGGGGGEGSPATRLRHQPFKGEQVFLKWSCHEGMRCSACCCGASRSALPSPRHPGRSSSCALGGRFSRAGSPASFRVSGSRPRTLFTRPSRRSASPRWQRHSWRGGGRGAGGGGG